MPMCAWVWGEGERVLSATSIFLWLCYNQSAFVFERSGPIIVLGLLSCAEYISSWRDISWRNAASILHSLQLWWSGKLIEAGLWPPVKRFKDRRRSERNNHTNIIHVLWNLHTGYTVVRVVYAVLISLSPLLACMMLRICVVFCCFLPGVKNGWVWLEKNMVGQVIGN